MKVQVTKKEMEFLNEISTSDFANEGWEEAEDGTVGDWVGADGKVTLPTDQYNMKVVRGLMSSLKEKGVIELRGTEVGHEGQPITWVNVSVEFCDIENNCLKNLEVAKATSRKENQMEVQATRAFTLTPTNEELLKNHLHVKVPVIFVEYGVEGYRETTHRVTSFEELNLLNKKYTNATPQDAFVLQNLSMFPNGNVEKLYELANKREEA